MGSSLSIIVTHDVSDFDGIAAAVAARKLYPDARMLRRRLQSSDVRAYLGIHGDRFEFEPFESIDQQSVRRLICVDLRRRSRLSPDFDPLLARIDAGDPDLSVHVYDHHAPSPDDLHGEVEMVEQTGAVMTQLLELLRQQGLPVDPVEATLFALGIYADTGALTYATTTPRDARAVAWLLEHGANLQVIERYMRPDFGAPQRALLAQLLSDVEVERVAGLDIGVVVAPLRRTISAMAPVTSEALRLSSTPALFAIYPVGSKRIQVIARASSPTLDVGAIMTMLGGGGHPSAGSTTVRGSNVQQVRARILEAVRQQMPKVPTLAGLMRPPVSERSPHQVAVDDTLEHAIALLAKKELPRIDVVDQGQVVGTVHRTDLMARLYDGQV